MPKIRENLVPNISQNLLANFLPSSVILREHVFRRCGEKHILSWVISPHQKEFWHCVRAGWFLYTCLPELFHNQPGLSNQLNNFGLRRDSCPDFEQVVSTYWLAWSAFDQLFDQIVGDMFKRYFSQQFDQIIYQIMASWWPDGWPECSKTNEKCCRNYTDLHKT